MIIAILLVALFALFFLVRKHTGPATLAMLAGVSVYQTFGGQFLDMAKKVAGDHLPESYLQAGICILFVMVFPIILYFRSRHGGLFGILRIAEAAILSAIMTLLVAPVLTNFDFLSFDSLSHQIVDYIKNYEGIIVLVGIITAYFDILMYRE
ncbi:hypothetical protein IKG54_00675 [Candidatus Saccharibacteria bacterium]|nr:hypothetical protein [Candidatus Saccharibacteria bacterium]